MTQEPGARKITLDAAGQAACAAMADTLADVLRQMDKLDLCVSALHVQHGLDCLKVEAGL